MQVKKYQHENKKSQDANQFITQARTAFRAEIFFKKRNHAESVEYFFRINNYQRADGHADKANYIAHIDVMLICE